MVLPTGSETKEVILQSQLVVPDLGWARTGTVKVCMCLCVCVLGVQADALYWLIQSAQ